jgi:hypothetical protein
LSKAHCDPAEIACTLSLICVKLQIQRAELASRRLAILRASEQTIALRNWTKGVQKGSKTLRTDAPRFRVCLTPSKVKSALRQLRVGMRVRPFYDHLSLTHVARQRLAPSHQYILVSAAYALDINMSLCRTALMIRYAQPKSRAAFPTLPRGFHPKSPPPSCPSS